MNTKEKIALLEEMFELDEGTLKADTLLADIPNWDSMSKLSFIVLMDDEFDQKIVGEQIRNLQTISDMLELMK